MALYRCVTTFLGSRAGQDGIVTGPGLGGIGFNVAGADGPDITLMVSLVFAAISDGDGRVPPATLPSSPEVSSRTGLGVYLCMTRFLRM